MLAKAESRRIARAHALPLACLDGITGGAGRKAMPRKGPKRRGRLFTPDGDDGEQQRKSRSRQADFLDFDREGNLLKVRPWYITKQISLRLLEGELCTENSIVDFKVVLRQVRVDKFRYM